MVAYVSKPIRKDLDYLRYLIESGDVKPVIYESFELNEVPEALRRFEEGHTRGATVVLWEPARPRPHRVRAQRVDVVRPRGPSPIQGVGGCADIGENPRTPRLRCAGDGPAREPRLIM